MEIPLEKVAPLQIPMWMSLSRYGVYARKIRVNSVHVENMIKEYYLFYTDKMIKDIEELIDEDTRSSV